MFCQVNDAFNSITSFSNNFEYTQKEKKFIKTLDYDKFEFILNMINDQYEIKDKEYSLFKQEYSNMKFEYIADVINTEKHEYHTVIDSTDNCLLLNALSPLYLVNYISNNITKKYIFLTLNYGSTLMDSSHQAAIMIDNHKKTIYMIDPNGKSDFLDNVFHETTNYYVETLLSNYFSELNKLGGLNYRYVPTVEWNNKKIAINKKVNNDYVGGGNCVVITLMLIHLIVAYSANPINAFEMLHNLSEEELLYIIKEYSLGVYNILRNK